jgi:ABC-type branched-subunit amino acid transport system ATPase component
VPSAAKRWRRCCARPTSRRAQEGAGRLFRRHAAALGIAQALLGNPKLAIVDEPTAGLDPEERTRFHNLLVETARK